MQFLFGVVDAAIACWRMEQKKGRIKMARKILVMTGSARRGGNSDLMADAFIKGAKLKGHEVIKYEAAAHGIKGCLYCNTCYSLGSDKACTHDDIFNELAPLYESCDTIVYVTSVFWFTFPAQIKAAIDKMYAFMVGKKPMGIRESMLLAVGAGKEDFKYEGLIRSYELIGRDRKWKDLGHYIVTGVNDYAAIKDTDHLAKIEELGKRI